MQQEIKVLPDNLKLWSGIRINQMDKICFRDPTLLHKFNSNYQERLKKIKLEVQQGKYSIIEAPKRESSPIIIPVIEKTETVKPKHTDKNGQLSLFG